MMNKYIKTDIEQAISYMKSAIMNALNDIDTGEEEEINLGPNISWNLFYDCIQEAGWEGDMDWETNGWEVDFWYPCQSPSGKYITIEGSLWCGQDYIIRVNHDNED